jgi:glycosyltransferase involved in cell wall biosynthesis
LFSKNVLWITPGFPSHDEDWNCLPVLQLLAHALTARGVALRIVALSYPHRTHRYTWHGIPVQPCGGRTGSIARFWHWRKAVHHARNWHNENPFDAVHSFWLGPAWVRGKKLAAQWGVPHVCTMMGQDVLPQNRYRHLLSQNDARNLVALSPFHSDRFKTTTGFDAGHVIPWGVEPPEAAPVTMRDIDVLGAGSLTTLKNWDLWLDTVALAAKNKPGLKAVLCGDGPEKTRLQQRAAAMETPVVFLGDVPRPDLLALMRRSRTFLHTSTFESFGMVLAEAASRGCRLVSTPTGLAPGMAQCAETAEALVELLFNDAAPKPFTRTVDDVAGAYLHLYGEL